MHSSSSVGPVSACAARLSVDGFFSEDLSTEWSWNFQLHDSDKNIKQGTPKLLSFLLNQSLTITDPGVGHLDRIVFVYLIRLLIDWG